ncbi:MAG: Mrp/NBP35 family ATP-binding protein [Aquificae bacterium]|nr:Mrp/NBP35 family ATP-binding protein [Aquificota bacterium]
MSVEEVVELLKQLQLKEAQLEGSLADYLKDARVTGGVLSLVFELPRPGLEDLIRSKVYDALKDRFEKLEVRFLQKGTPVASSPAFTRKQVPGVKHLVAVGSGKGGVGKSTVAVNLALALSRLGYRVGLLDADVYGPSVPTLMGLKGARVEVDEARRLVPVEKEGIKVLSIGFMLPSEDTPVIWRGPMLMRALMDFLFNTAWGELDYLIMDLPPGTGDVQITLAQHAKLDGSLVVTTPQDVALADVKKAVNMFKEVGVPVLGVVENMAYFKCPSDGKAYYIFGKGKVEEFARSYGLPLLGSIPVDPELSRASDEGRPVVLYYPESESAKAFMSLARALVEKTS